MNTKSFASLVMGLLMCVSLGASAHGNKHHGNKRLVLQLLGTGNLYESTVPDIDGDMIDDPAICFDMDLINFATGKVIGTGTDCFANVTSVGSGISVDATMFLNMPRGSLTIRTKSSAQPVVRETVRTSNGEPYTHIAGASSNLNGIIGGTGRFRDATGTVRFSGMLNMAELKGEIGDPVLIDCIFIVELD